MTKRKGTASVTHQRVIRRLEKEIDEIDQLFYGGIDGDIGSKRFMLERKLDDIVRSVVLQMHTAIEDVLDGLLRNRFLGIKAEDWRAYVRAHRTTAKELEKVMTGGGALGFDQKIRLLRGLGVLRKDTCKKLTDMNQLRNKCSHNWLLNVHVRRGVERRAPKRPLLQFRKRSLYNIDALREFTSVYGGLYGRLFVRTL